MNHESIDICKCHDNDIPCDDNFNDVGVNKLYDSFKQGENYYYINLKENDYRKLKIIKYEEIKKENNSGILNYFNRGWP